ncbi:MULTISPECIES: PsiF family protein [Methylobacterium]|uniref:PsiF family protein n=1 Tax=Methylobacterium TaxID=407 RepID=UPI002F3514B8
MSALRRGEGGGRALESGDHIEPPERTPRQAKMKSCNADASLRSLTGVEREAFLSTCLKGWAPAAAAPSSASGC